MNRKNFILAVILMIVALIPGVIFGADTTPPASPVKLVFIHHSTGGHWLADPNDYIYGGLGTALKNNNYYVSATNYEWGPNGIGSRTDIPNWTEWFTGENSSTIMNAVYSETAQNIGDFGAWSRLPTAPGGENTIVMFKSCFPNSNLYGNPDDPAASEPNDSYSVSNAKAVYNKILTYFQTRQDKLFIVITAPPQTENESPDDPDLSKARRAANARAFNNWLMNNWLSAYPYKNVAVFDYFNVMTHPDNHHRISSGTVEHVTSSNSGNFAYYPFNEWDSHPNSEGQQKAVAEFVPLLNYFYNSWKGGASPVITNCIEVGDDLKLNIFAQYQGSQYGFVLNYAQVSEELWDFYWKADISTFAQIQRDPAACIPVSDDLRLNVCIQHHGTTFEFSLDYTPVPADASGFYWKMDTATFRQR